MVALAGYEGFVLLHEGANSHVYRARRVSDGQPVILKFLNQDYPTPEQTRRYKQEYHLTCLLDSSGIVKAYSLEEWQRSYAIALEDFGAIALKQWLKQHEKLSLAEFLFLAIAITDSLRQIHDRDIIHKDINPTNIVFNSETKELKIIDFGISTQLSQENPPLKSPNVLEGTLAYISPEQTGRMNRGVDYRTDFYSLGVTFYELLTGKLPFFAEDALELVHCHIAKMPEGLGNREQKTGDGEEVPQILADIVMKLMAKNAEDRYQSAYGLKADLEICVQHLEETGKIATFSLGQQDSSDRFQIPQKLYGREEEIETLLAAFDRVTSSPEAFRTMGDRRGGELILVAGYSGIGKSSLVQELYKPITARRGYFISGKFDQFQRNIPYSAIVTAFRGLIDQLLGESEAQLQLWREQLLKALGNNGQIIIDVIPEVELIIGKQPAVPVLEANEAQNRFNLVIGNFIRACCDKNHPITLFLDDLQWADLATLKLVERLLVEGQTQYLLLLGAYRDNEVSASHPLAIALAKLQQNDSDAIAKRGDSRIAKRGDSRIAERDDSRIAESGGSRVAQMTLRPLSLDQIANLIGDTLQQTPDILDLAQVILQKTGGNPFFINEFLQALYDEELLQFDRRTRSWQWDVATIEARDFTDNVVELMVGKLQKLPASGQEILSLAACLGAEFNLTRLTWIAEKSPQEIFELLTIALNRSFIFPLSEPDENLLIQSYKFAHDRIQQAAYALIPDVRKEATHYRIGQLLLQKISPEAREDNIFELVSQFNYGMALINEQKERDALARLNLIACRKARNTNAYQAGQEYASQGLSLLGENAWQRQYQISLEFHELAAELAFLCGDFEGMEQFIELAIAQTHTVLDRIKVYRIRIASTVSQHKLLEAITIARGLLQELGVNLPTDPTEKDIRQAIAEIEPLIGDREIEDLVHLPIMTDGKKIAIVEIVTSIMPAAHNAGSPLFPLLVALHVKLSIQYGNTSSSAVTYVTYDLIACTHLQDVDTGIKFGQLAFQIVSKPEVKPRKPGVLCLLGFAILHRKFHIKETLPLHQEAYAAGLEVGDLEFVGFAAHNFCFNAFWCGQSLATLVQDVRAYVRALVQLNQLTTANYCRMHWQSTLNLLGFTEHPSILSGEALQEAELLPQLLSARDFIGLFSFYLYKLMLCYLFGELDAAQHSTLEIQRYCAISTGTVGEPAFYFYDSLTTLATLSLHPEEPLEALHQVEQNQRQLQHHWARYAPMNHQHKVDLVEAEKCRVLGQKTAAIEFYNKAISGAKENEYIQEEALANELTAKFYLDWGLETAARAYMIEAHYCYSRWGAKAKVKQLEENYPQWCQASTTRPSATTTLNTNTTSEPTESSALDLATAIKAANAISSEIVLENLLATLMNILVENAGAERGILLLPRGEDLSIEAIQETDSPRLSILQSLAIEEYDRISSKIVYYVARTGETVVTNNAVKEDRFNDDSYIQQNQCQSIACTPLINQGKLQGIVYLENNLTTGAFTQGRMALLRTLATQAAISLENARLYETLEQRVEERTAELSQTVEVLKKTQAELQLENDLLKSDVAADSFTYQLGGTLDMNSPTYVVRSADRHLYQAMRIGEFCYTFNARQMGKSSLMVRILKKLREDGYRCIAIDLTRIGSENATPDQWYKGFAVELWLGFGLLQKIKLKAWWAEHLDIPAPQRLMRFVEEVLLVEVEREESSELAKMVVFLDEIDCILSLGFPVDDFFALIRSCYNRRAIDSNYKRLTFAIFGAAAPSTLIVDPQKTPFNIGRPIHLEGFKINEAQPLLRGLSDKVNNPQTTLKEIIRWTGGQPFLTQKVCHLIRNAKSEIPINKEAQWLEELVRENILMNWEIKDDPEHLKTVRDRVLHSDRRTELLSIYQQIVLQGEVPATYSDIEQELLLSGLAIAKDGHLKVNNRIYQSIFNRQWVETQLIANP